MVTYFFERETPALVRGIQDVQPYLGGDEAVIWPTVLTSLACLGLNVGLLQYLYAMEKQFT